MELIDKKFKKNKLKYTVQCLLTVIAVFFVLMLLDIQTNVTNIASLGASAFIVFTLPHRKRSKPRFLIGGYIVGIVSAIICFGIYQMIRIEGIHFFGTFLLLLFSALSVGLSMFLMVVTNTEHPPATSLALGLFLDHCQIRTIIVVLVGIIVLSVIKKILKHFLIDLI